MPFWQRSSPEDEQRRLQAQQEAEASRRSLEAGDLPLQASRRLSEETAAGHSLFSSDLSTKEFALTRNVGYQPLSQVMGSSIYRVGWQYARTYASYPSETELTTISQAHMRAAQLDTPLPQRPFLSDLSGQEFWTLLQAGYYPVGIAVGYCSYYVSLGSYIAGQMRGWFNWSNQEIDPFSQGIYTARDLAMNRAVNMARSFNASGIVGMHIDCEREVIDYETDNPTRYYMDFIVRFSAIGTAIAAQRPDHVIPSPTPTLTLTDLRPGQRGETRELTVRE